MNRTFKQLTAEQRYQIATLLSKGFNQKQIAVFTGKSESCICRELKRNKMYSGKYDAKNAHQYAVFRHETKPKKIRYSVAIQQQVNYLLQQDLSPQQISHRLALEGHDTVSLMKLFIYTFGKIKSKMERFINT